MYSDFYDLYHGYYNRNILNNERENNNFASDEIITLNQAIELIKQSVADEKEDELFYDKLILQAPTEKEKTIISSIRDDERKHNYILRELYFEFTGQRLSQEILQKNLDSHTSYQDNLEKALFGELNAVTKYRKIMGVMPSGDSYNLLMSIMTDELRHASKYNFLISNLTRN